MFIRKKENILADLNEDFLLFLQNETDSYLNWNVDKHWNEKKSQIDNTHLGAYKSACLFKAKISKELAERKLLKHD